MTASWALMRCYKRKSACRHVWDKLDHVFKAAKLLSATIKQILDFTQIEVGVVTETVTEFSLRQNFARIEEIALKRAAAKNLYYHSDIDPAIPIQLLGDGEKSSRC